jgi:hypothetical protein
MKQLLNLTSEDPRVVEFIRIWMERKGYSGDLTIGYCLELLIGITQNFHTDHSVGRFFNHVLENEESAISFDGEELLDILYYELRKAILKRLSISRVFPDTTI